MSPVTYPSGLMEKILKEYKYDIISFRSCIISLIIVFMENTTKKKSIISKILIFIIGVIIGGGSLWTWNYYMPKSASSVSQTDQSQIKSLIEKAGKLVILPTGEDPVVATISDAASLIKEQIFYKNAINGDVVLVYQKAAKA